ncbi:hypothetical protein WQ54_09925 [Bacillus sp. SA1-12]|uniref:SPOR domain-containing protein n=1 Tax=Bacillus sp. SA1-12 TaxID=1455638 RepID=UPI0006251151|nr:SPOR domain-containing protein [Bacillus sp. SA1-12]KKI92302.1 hypothetical protein WQ54_09925 [Bacillus sp. SA1-12]
MDKHTSDTIKIKINGKERQLSQEEKTAGDLAVSSWDEKLKAENEVATAKQPIEKEDDFPWLLPEEDDSVFMDDPKVVTPSKKKIPFSNQTITPYQYANKKNRNRINGTFPFKKIVTIILLAIGLGFMFGLIGLNFLSNEDMPTMGSSDDVTTEGGSTAGEPSNQENSDDKDTAGNEAAASTATLNLYAVQGGIFSAKAGAETVASQIKEKGFAATVIETNGSYTVFAGFGKERTETGSLSETYQKQNWADIEFWGGKELSLTISTGNSAEQWASVIQELSSLAAAAAIGNTPGQEAVTKIETSINGIKANGEEEKSLIENLKKAGESIKNNNGWEAQQSVLDVTSKITAN